MNLEIKQRIEQIKKGQVPQGYKKTKVGIVPSEWEVKKLTNICKTVGGGTPDTKNEYYWSGQIPWISSSDIVENNIFDINIHRFITEQAILNSATKKVPKNSILLVSRVGVGKLAISSCDICTSQDFTNLTDIKGNIYTIAYLVKFSIDLKLKMLQGTSIKGITTSEIKNLDIIYPSILEQQKIAEILSTQDKVIELKEKLIEEKQKQKKYLMQNLLTGKIRLKGFTGEWKKVKLGEVCDVVKGEQINKSTLNEFGKYYVLNGGITPSGYTDVWNTYENTISISEGGNSCGFVNFNREKFWSGGHCYTLQKINTDLITKEFLYCYLKHYENNIMNLRVGSGLPNIQKSSLYSFLVIFPSLEEQKVIANILSTADKEIELLQKQLEEEKQKKKSLMQLLLTGIVRV